VALRATATEHEREVFDLVKRSVRTPRELKRLVGSFAVLEEIVRDEINPYDVLGYAWLLTKSPAVIDAIADAPDRVVEDPDSNEMADRLTKRMDEKGPPRVGDVLGKAAEAHEDLVKHLFPRFKRSHRDEAWDRLSKRRNLVRLLYLGNPPGMVPKKEVERIWSLPDTTSVVEALREVRDRGELRGFVDRLGDLLAQLPSSDDASFWTGLARLLVRQTPWAVGVEEERSVADDAIAFIIRLGMKNAAGAVRVRGILSALIEDRDLVLAPGVIRKHLLALGLSQFTGARREQLVLDQRETLDLYERELPRYRAAALDGTLLSMIPNADALFAIGNRGNWDDLLRASMTSQLAEIEPLATMAMLLVPPGYGIERKALDELFDVSVVLQRLESLRSQGDWPEDLPLAAALERLRYSMRERETLAGERVDAG
jgi:hypothetical protein